MGQQEDSMQTGSWLKQLEQSADVVAKEARKMTKWAEVEVNRINILRTELVKFASDWSLIEDDDPMKTEKRTLLLNEMVNVIDGVEVTAQAMYDNLSDESFGNDEEGLHGK